MKGADWLAGQFNSINELETLKFQRIPETAEKIQSMIYSSFLNK